MKLKSIVFSVVLLLSFSIYAQTELECKTNLSNAHAATQAKNYDSAYEPWLYVKKNCPDLNLATYADGEKIMKHKIETSKGEVQLSFVNTLLDLWILRYEHFKNDTPKGEFDAKASKRRQHTRADSTLWPPPASPRRILATQSERKSFPARALTVEQTNTATYFLR